MRKRPPRCNHLGNPEMNIWPALGSLALIGVLWASSLLRELAPFELENHLPSFPIPFTLPFNNRLYFYFPEDSKADHYSSLQRCRALYGELSNIDIEDASVEREMLACIIDTPIHIVKKGKKAVSEGGECTVMMPGGIIVSSRNLCKRELGSVCSL
jgi:hypothetical protein